MPNRSCACWVPVPGICRVFAFDVAPAGDRLLGRLAEPNVNAADPSCFETPGLTTASPSTAPADNSLAASPTGSLPRRTDRAAIWPTAPNRTPVTRTVAVVQPDAPDDPARQAGIVIRLPDQGSGRLVVSGAWGTCSEFNGDAARSGFALQPASRIDGVQSGSHIETDTNRPPAFPQLAVIEPHARNLFDRTGVEPAADLLADPRSAWEFDHFSAGSPPARC